MEKTQKPAIRFDGFVADWEQRKFSDMFSERREKTTVEYEDVLLSCAISGMYLNSELFDHFRGTSTIGYLKVRKNDLILSAQNLHLGNANVNLRFDHGIISPAYKVYDLVDCDPQFIQAWVKKEDTKDFFLSASTEGASQCRKNIDWDTLEKQCIMLPGISEQQTIGKYICQINTFITLHQQKYDKLLTFKKSMLEKLFTRNGAKVPEVRFAGFEGEWGFRKFGEVFEEYSEKNHDELPALTIIQGVGTVRRDESGRSIQYDESGLKGYKLVREGDFIVHLRSFEGGLEKANSTGIVSPAYHMFHGEGTDTRFFYAYFRSKQFVDVQLKPHVYGIRDGRSIDIAGMKTILIPYPSLPEQQKIGDFLGKIDDLISSSQTELEKLKNIKSALLEKMFV